MQASDFDYTLPAESVAQHPLPERDASRMLLLERHDEKYTDHSFAEISSLLRGDELIVVNNSKVIPARLFAYRVRTRAQPPGKQSIVGQVYLRTPIEILLLRRIEIDLWEALVRPGRKVRVGEQLKFAGAALEAEVVSRGALGLRHLRFHSPGDTWAAIESIGHIPLPPYIRRPDGPADRERYQTVYAANLGSVAAPTAGLHFTPGVIEQLKTRGIEVCEITLDVGLGTFQPIRTENLEDHRIYGETYHIPSQTADAIAAARRTHRPILAIGTTVVRALEDAARKAEACGRPLETIATGQATAELFIRPGHRFALVDQLLTNFHLPRSTLLVLVASFAGREFTLAAYRYAVAARYRFYSYGDCMLIR